MSKLPSAKGSSQTSACTSGTVTPVRSAAARACAQHPGGQIERDHRRALAGQVAGARRGAAADLEDPPAA